MISIFFVIFLSIDLAAGISVCKKSQRTLKVHSNDGGDGDGDGEVGGGVAESGQLCWFLGILGLSGFSCQGPLRACAGLVPVSLYKGMTGLARWIQTSPTAPPPHPPSLYIATAGQVAAGRLYGGQPLSSSSSACQTGHLFLSASSGDRPTLVEEVLQKKKIEENIQNTTATDCLGLVLGEVPNPHFPTPLDSYRGGPYGGGQGGLNEGP